MGIADILKVFYAPHKVFKEIVKNPTYIVPLIVLVLFVVAQFGSSYIVASKSLFEQTMPSVEQTDVWTENATLWMADSGVIISENKNDFINASAYYNATSIEFKVSNSSSIQMALISLDGSVNCGTDGFKNMSFRMKIIEPNVQPGTVTVFLYSLGDTDYFAYDLTSVFSADMVNVWNNITIPVGSGDWSSTGLPKWENITSLKMIFTWNDSQNIDLRIDGLFFRGRYEEPLVVYGSAYLLSSVINSFTHFLFQWLVLTALMYLLIKGFKGNVVWKPLIISVGVALIIIVVQTLILAVTYSTLPNIYYPLELLAGVAVESDVAYQVIVDLVASATFIAGAVQLAVLAWNVGLGTFITREVTSAPMQTAGESEPIISQPLSLMRCFLISLASVLLSLVVLYFIGV